jgi:hypothetical protein
VGAPFLHSFCEVRAGELSRRPSQKGNSTSLSGWFSISSCMKLKVDVKSALSAILIGHVDMRKDVSKLFDAIG